LVISDKSFTTDGQLYYGGEVENPNFSSWIPEFFGNTMLVNGVLWPKMTLKNKKYRFVLLNICTSRFLNIWFDNAGKKIPFDLIRVDGSFYSSPVTRT
jgi:spore coat protein A